jgi:electron transfer flavoprotein alpha subunit
MVPSNKDVWVIVEQRDGEITQDSIHLIGEARRLLEIQRNDGTVSVLAFGAEPKILKEVFGRYGVETLFYCENITRYEPDLYVSAICDLVVRYHPTSVLLAATSFWNDVGARLAAKLETVEIGLNEPRYPTLPKTFLALGQNIP